MKREISVTPIRQAYWLFLLFVCAGQALFAQDLAAQELREIRGTVTDSADGNPLPGVSITLKNGSEGIQSDPDGTFRIQASARDVLVFSLLGYESREVLVGNNATLEVAMQQGIASLEEVVVVGYGTQKKRDVTGAIVSVSSEQIQERQALNVFDALQGMAPGVQIAQESGRPGAGSSVRIRGTATLEGGANPLYIVDGAQGVDIEGLNPDDIASIEVLKDGASAAIYGARSANGVIIITTKKGQQGKPQIKGSYLNSYSTLSHKIPQANAAERRLFEIKRGGNGIQTDSLNPSYNADNDYQDLITQTAQRHQLDLSLGGRSDKMSYYGSLGYLDEEGIIVNSWYKRITGRLNLDYSPGERFAYGSRIQFGYRNENRIHEGNTLNQAIPRPPTYAVYFPDGTLAPTISGRRNPLAWALLDKDEYNIYDANIYNFMSYELLDGLKFTADATVNFRYSSRDQFTPKILNTNTGASGEAFSNGSERTDLTNYWMIQGYFNYEKTLSGDHALTGVLGLSADRYNLRRNNLAGNDWLSEEIPTMNAAQELLLNNIYSNGVRNTAASAFGRIGYGYKGKYLFQSNFRLDGSSRFGKDNRWGFFPSVSAAWRFSDESFMEWSGNYLDDGKVRLSYGITGNDRIGDYDAIQRYVFGSNYYNEVSGVVPNSLFGNNVLGWESTSQFNAGLDLTFFNSRLSLVVDYYDKITDNLLYSAPLPLETGYNNVKMNLGSIQNKGLEILLSGDPVRGEHFTWNTAVNFSFNRGTVKELYGGTELLVDNIWLVEEGQPLGNFYGWKQLGVFAYDESNAWTDDWEQLTPGFDGEGNFTGYTLNGAPYTGNVRQKTTTGSVSKGGDTHWYDANNDGVIDDSDRIVLGNAQPKWMAGWNNALSYKGLSLSFNFYFSFGGKIYNEARWVMSTFRTSGSTPDPYIIHNAWSKPGDVTDVPIPINNGMENVRELGSRYLEDASFIRLRNLKISYQLPSAIISPAGLERATIYLYGTNLLTWSDYSWFDPEVAFGNPLQMGRDTGRYPRKRELGLGLNLNF